MKELIKRYAKIQEICRWVNFSNFIISDEDCAIIAHILSNSRPLHLDLRNCNLSAVGASAIGREIRQHLTLTYLCLGGNNIGDSGAIAIANGLKTNSTLEHLDLNSNRIWHDGLTAITKSLEANATLKNLYLVNNWIGDLGAFHTSNALSKNSTLEHLDLSSNIIGDIGAFFIFYAVSQKTTNIFCNIEHNRHTTDYTSKLTNALRAHDKVLGEPGKSAINEPNFLKFLDSSLIDQLLIKAAQHSIYESIVIALLDIGASIDAYDENGNTALIHAAMCHNVNITRILLDSGADPNIQNIYGESAFLRAVSMSFNDVEMPQMMVDKVKDINAQCSSGDTALLVAVTRGNSALVQILLNNGANPNIQNNKGNSPLLQAAYDKKEELVRKLIAHGAELNTQNDQGETALIIAAKRDSEYIVFQLTEAGATLDIQDKLGRTALYWAAKKDYHITICILIDAGAKIDIKDNEGIDALNMLLLSWRIENVLKNQQEATWYVDSYMRKDHCANKKTDVNTEADFGLCCLEHHIKPSSEIDASGQIVEAV